MEHIVYFLFSEKLDKFYIGYTSDLEVRFDFHLNDIQTRKFTHKAEDWILVFKIDCETKSQALAIEKHIKAMKSKVYLQNLMKDPEMSLKLLEKHK